MKHDKITILDFGSQYTQLIARRIRELNVYAEILPCYTDLKRFNDDSLKGVILSGGPSSVMDDNAPTCDNAIFELGVPILGICYGMQYIAKMNEGELTRATRREYGRQEIKVCGESQLFSNCPETSTVWMSHGDNVESIPEDFTITASTENLPVAAMESDDKKTWCLQFHPEVVHTEYGKRIIDNFLDITEAKRNWKPENFAQTAIEKIQAQTEGKGKIIIAFSGGVDSTVMSALITRAVPEKVIPIFVNNGLLRKDEAEEVRIIFEKTFGIDLIVEDASGVFYEKLKDVTDPEKKRKIIGHTFIDVFVDVAKRYDGVDFLAQGTLYPDIIESVSTKGPSASIKSHHNVGGLPEKLNFELIEPLKELFKDDVRSLGESLGIEHDVLYRHPFPGPGLGVRILGDITPERVRVLQEADAIFMKALKDSGYYEKIWQAFVVLLPVKSVGVMGDERTYENVCSLRAVHSLDGMTADFAHIPFDLLGKISNDIINNVKGINRVVYDISSKPPATIEWE